MPIIALASQMALVAALHAGDGQHTFIDLGTLTDRSSHGFGLSNVGYVVGWSHISGTPGTPKNPAVPFINHAFLWQSAPGTGSGVMTDLGAFPGDGCSPLGCESRANDISDLGLIVGWSADPYQIPFIWSAEATAILNRGLNALPSLFGDDTNSEARAINEWMQIVGESRGPGGIPRRVALWEHDGAQWTVTDLGTMQPGDTGHGGAYDINELSQIVGQANVPGGDQHAFLHLPEAAYGLPAGMNDLTPSMGSSTALAINDLGQIVGVIGALQGWIWLPEPALGFDAGLSLLPGFDGGVVYPSDINNRGQIVGTVVVFKDKLIIYRGVLFESGRWIALDDLFPDGTPWTIHNFALSAAINDEGQITGDARSESILDINGFPAIHAYRLDPPASIPGDIAPPGGDGVVGPTDLAELLANWGKCPLTGACDADLDDDGVVGPADLANLLANWS